MAQVVNGRYTARMEEPFVVFMIGMRISRPSAIKKWLPTFRAMGPMPQELYEHPEKGFLGAEYFFYWPGVAVLQYWRRRTAASVRGGRATYGKGWIFVHVAHML